MINKPPFTIGIEEEYILVNKESRDVAIEPPEEMLEACLEAMPGQISPEFLRAQIEVGTKVCSGVKEAREELNNLRGCIATIGDRYNLAPIAASTHPFAAWHEQKRTNHARYHELDRDMQASARRLLICGMHVHVGIDDDDLRIDLMNQFAYFLPHLLALSCSSPFWVGDDTGLQSYRLTVFDGMPRTRLPEKFASYSEYQRHVETLISSGVMEDATKIWWDVRPSARYPTLEMRVTDVCTRIDDSLCIAAMSQSFLSMLFRLRNENQRWREYAPMLVAENRWRAMRYGTEQGLIDFGRGALVPYGELFEEMLRLIREDAEELGCLDEVLHARRIIERGNSARQQREIFNQAVNDGAERSVALQQVVDHLISETRKGSSADT